MQDFENNIAEEMKAFDPVYEIEGAKSLIDFFRDTGIPFSFATGALPKPTLLKLEQCSIWYEKRLLATSMTHETREGFVTDAIEKAKSFYNISSFTNIVSIGDGLWDLKTAQNLSIDFVGIGNKNKEKLINNGATNWCQDINAFRKAMF